MHSWEYPAQAGIGCNEQSASDASNYLSFLQELRAQLPTKTLSAAVGLQPFTGSSGSPMSDVSGFYDVLDYIEVMNYDVHGSFSASVGANAPLNDSCAPAADQQGCAQSAIQAWEAAGFPASQIVLGVPAYGHSFYVTNQNALVSGSKTQLRLYPPFVASKQPAGDAWNPTTGDFDFWGLIDGGFLNKDGSVASGILSVYDSCADVVRTMDFLLMTSFD